MEWISFFIGMGAMVLLIVVVFLLVPERRNKKPDVQMQVLHDYWRQSIATAQISQNHFKSIAETLQEIRDRRDEDAT